MRTIKRKTENENLPPTNATLFAGQSRTTGRAALCSLPLTHSSLF